MKRVGFSLVLALGLALGTGAHAAALQQVSAGKAVGAAWTFLPLNIGQREGIFKRYGIDLNIVVFQGDAKLQQGLTSGSIGFGLGSGPGMAFAAKGVPAKAVAAYFGAPRNLAVLVKANSPIKTVKDLKGKKVAISTVGSLTQWLVQRVSLTEGWGKDGIKTVALGGVGPGIAAMRAGEVDGVMGAYEAGLMLEQKHLGSVLVPMTKYAPEFITHVVYARDELIAHDPGLVKRFLEGFFSTLQFIKTHKDVTNKVAEEVLKLSPTVAAEAYDHEVGGFILDGRFNPKAVAVLKKSWIARGVLPHEPKDSEIFTTRFVPVRIGGK